MHSFQPDEEERMRAIARAMVLVTLLACAAGAETEYLKDKGLAADDDTSASAPVQEKVRRIMEGTASPEASPRRSTIPSPAAAPAPEPEPEPEPEPSRKGYGNEGAVKLGVDVAGNHSLDLEGVRGDITDKVSSGFSLACEGVHYFDENVGIGGGIGYQVPRRMDKYRGGFSFVPLYLVSMVRTTPLNGYSFYGTGQFGYSFFEGDSDYRGTAKLGGGMHAGLGAGITFKPLFLELLYTVDQGTYKFKYRAANMNCRVQYTKLTVSIGVMLF
jgi:hypothetical protein